MRGIETSNKEYCDLERDLATVAEELILMSKACDVIALFDTAVRVERLGLRIDDCVGRLRAAHSADVSGRLREVQQSTANMITGMLAAAEKSGESEESADAALCDRYEGLVDCDDLADTIIDEAVRHANAVNNAGLPDQIEFLVWLLGKEAAEKVLETAAKRKAK
jgi:hypothetical protein